MTSLARYPSLETRWLQHACKDMPQPVIAYANYAAGGCYYFPQRAEVALDGRYFDLRRGLIVISTRYTQDVRGVVAHEWRHAWQHYRWPEAYERSTKPNWSSEYTNYRQAIVRYFTASPWERDALAFELRVAPCDRNKEWAEWMVPKYYLQ